MRYGTLTQVANIKCPACGSSNIVVDYKNGSVVCRSCGLVLEENSIVEYSVTFRGIEIADRTPEAKRPLDKYAVKHSKLRLATLRNLEKYSKKLKTPINEVYTLLLNMNLSRVSEYVSILGDECIIKCISRLKSVEKIALIKMIKEYLDGTYPLVSLYSIEYGVDPVKLRRVFKRVLVKCLNAR